MFFITSNQKRIHYLGQGPKAAKETLVFVLGWGYSMEVFQKQVDYFCRNYRVVSIDPQGHGKSQRTKVEVSQEQQARDLLELLQECKIEKAIFVGWSYGAYPILELVRQCGLQYIQKILIIDQPPKCTGNQKEDWVEYQSENIERTHDVL